MQNIGINASANDTVSLYYYLFMCLGLSLSIVVNLWHLSRLRLDSSSRYSTRLLWQCNQTSKAQSGTQTSQHTVNLLVYDNFMQQLDQFGFRNQTSVKSCLSKFNGFRLKQTFDDGASSRRAFFSVKASIGLLMKFMYMLMA